MDPIPVPAVAIGAPKRHAPGLASIFWDLSRRIVLVALIMAGALAALYFPRANDGPLTAAEQADLRRFYATAYDKAAAPEKEDTRYVQIAETEANQHDVKGYVTEFASVFGLKNKKVLDIGAGRGYLQDIVNDYTALDISPSVKRFFHKPFVLASATLMPFPPSQFDAAWTIWVFEHVPNPEAALVETRRVVKDGGLLYLAPAWDCNAWAADGYPVRPYSDFGLLGKLVKASIPVRVYFGNLAKAPVRLARYLAWKVFGGPTTFRYNRLTPNYEHYWMADSDAVNSLDRYETALWFLSRGDECLNCQGALRGLFQGNETLVIRVHKPAN
jgi:SAM-dependent methyltransferase